MKSTPQPSSSSNSKKMQANQTSTPKKENTFLNLAFNLLLPILILNKGQSFIEPYLGTRIADPALLVLLIALAFPIGYFVYDYKQRKKYNFFSILGLVSVLLTGGIGILEIPTKWFAIKEAAIPLLLGLAVLISLKTRYPLIRTLLYNPEMIETEKVQAQLERTQQQAQFDSLLSRCTVLLASSFFLSAGLNYILARNIVVSPSGSDAFNTEVSKMMAWSWPIIAVPSMLIMVLTLILLIKGIKRMTGLGLEEVLKGSAGRT